MNQDLRVFVLEDDARIRQHLEALIGRTPGFALGGSAASLSQAQSQKKQAKACDILLVDLQLPDGHGSEYIRQAAGWQPRPRIAVVSALGDERNVLKALQAGADGYLLKDVGDLEFGHMLQALRQGQAPLSPGIARHLLKQFHNPPNQKSIAGQLSGREVQVLELAAKGYAYNEIADSLGVAASTVNTHVKHIYRKLGVNSRSEAVFEAVQAGLIRIN